MKVNPLLESIEVQLFLNPPTKIFLKFGVNEKSFSDVGKEVISYGKKLGIKPGYKVLLMSENSPEWIYICFSTFLLGGTLIPVDYQATEKELFAVIDDSKPHILIIPDSKLSTIKPYIEKIGINSAIFGMNKLKAISIPSREFKIAYSDMEDTAVIIYTSGTTGDAKGVMLSYKNLWSNLSSISALNLLRDSDNVLAILPFHHSYPLMVTLLFPLYVGATLTLLERLHHQELIRCLREDRITFFVAVPKVYNMLTQAIWKNINMLPNYRKVLFKILYSIAQKAKSPWISKLFFSSIHKSLGSDLRLLISGGAKLDSEVARRLKTLGLNIIEGYGLTETSPVVSFNPPDNVKIGSVGKPLNNVRIKIRQVDGYTHGEILVKGDNVMKGYYNREEDTARVMEDGWLCTGDLGYIDKDGYLYITGRKKDVIVLPSGKNVYPEELEAAIEKSPLIEEVAVLEKEGFLHALIRPIEDLKRLGIDELNEKIHYEIRQISQGWRNFQKIKRFKTVFKELPKTRLGKLKRYQIDTLYWE